MVHSGATTLRILTLSIMTLIKMRHSVNHPKYDDEYRYVHFVRLSIVLLNVVMLSVINLIVVMLRVIVLKVIVLSVIIFNVIILSVSIFNVVLV
jgi:hypothetical protein